MYGKRQRLPSPAAAPIAARIKSHFDFQRGAEVVIELERNQI
jgi:hypothetical protein